MADTYIEGWKGILSVWDTTASAYKPLACLTKTSHSMQGVTKDKVNYCTQGKTITTLQSVNETVDFEGEVIDTTAVGGANTKVSLGDLKELMRKQALNKSVDTFKLDRDFDGVLYFPGQILSLSDTYQADSDATFTGQLSVLDTPTSVDPHAAP